MPQPPATCSAALDTSSIRASFVVRRDEDGAVLVADHQTQVGRRSAGLLAVMARHLAEAGLEWGQIRRWTVGMGPGSFTGIRVGAALVRGLSSGTGAAWRGLPTSLAIAAAARLAPGERLHVLHDGRQDEVIVTTCAGVDGGPAIVVEARAIPLAELPDDGVRCAILAPDPLQELLRQRLGERLIVQPGVDATWLLDTGQWPADEAAAIHSLEPVYVRPAVFIEPLTNTPPAAAARWLQTPPHKPE